MIAFRVALFFASAAVGCILGRAFAARRLRRASAAIRDDLGVLAAMAHDDLAAIERGRRA